VPTQSYCITNIAKHSTYPFLILLTLIGYAYASSPRNTENDHLIVISDSLRAQVEISNACYEYEKSLALLKQVVTIEPRINRTQSNASALVEISRIYHSIDQWVIQALTALKWHAPEEEIQDQFAHLYGVLLQPSEPEIDNYPNLVIIPYGILHYLPFHMLRNTDLDGEQHYLVESKRISYLPSASFLTDLLREQAAASQDLLAFGNADGTLPSAELEVDLIARLFRKSHVCKCDSARKDRLIQMANDYRLIHLATHGVLASDPRFSYIVLAPAVAGNLTVREIFGLSGHFKQTSLVTLSACETAVEAEPEAAGMELVTLSNAFKVAGVPTTIASLWEIADRSTALLMEDFYKNIKDKNLDKLDALRNAQLSMLDNEQYAHPYYWAPFILIGDWQ
jgi:CHAT domain-containing protein